MNQENLNEKEIEDLIKNLDEVGLSSPVQVLLSFSVIPNEFLYTNTGAYIQFYSQQNSLSPDTRIMYLKERDQNILKISGPSFDVKKIQKDFPNFPWVDSESVKVISDLNFDK